MESSVMTAGDAAQEVVGQIKWFDMAKGYGFIKPSGGLAGRRPPASNLRAPIGLQGGL